MAHLLAVDEGAGVVDAELVAELIEVFLVVELADGVAGNVGGDAVGGEGLLVLGRQLHIAVAAAHDQNGLVRKLSGHVGHVLAEGLGVLVLGADPVVDDIGAVSRAGGKLAKADRLDPVGLVEGTGHAVDVDVPAEEQGLEIVFHGSRFFLWFGGHGKEPSREARLLYVPVFVVLLFSSKPRRVSPLWRRKTVKSFFPAACTWEKILLTEGTCGPWAVR